MSNICAPDKYDSKNNTCLSLEQLIEMAKAYNIFMTKKVLAPESSNIKISNAIKIKPEKKYLLLELKKRFDKICGGDEICITKQSFMDELVKEMRDDINENTFRTTGPEKDTEWLNTNHINAIMKQYQNVYPDFVFMGAVPIDCAELSFCSLYNINFEEFEEQNKKHIGTIYNLDKYGEPGSHWVCLYINLLDGEIYYVDSTGKKPPKYVEKIIDSFKTYYQNKNNKPPIYKYNTKSYQKDGSECGIYSCNFLIRKLAGESYESIIEKSLNFEQINSCRNAYFNNNPSKNKVHPSCDPKN